MKKINWRLNIACDFWRAQVGNVVLSCYRDQGNDWLAFVDFNGSTKEGDCHKSLGSARQEAIDLACELLLEYREALEKEMDNFEMTGVN
ncbi:hypothetical protein LCGC14_0140670 [marine sediment metagenome]|uniref:Uncharacterized protein n=1 Tax=marine sediment metagenome TaxID=412755 RepID=A0A0F9XI39_9ZZZZ